MPATTRTPQRRIPTSRAADGAPRGASVARERAVAEVVDAIRAIVRELRVSARDAEQRLGIHGAQLFALQQLADGPAHSLAELAERTRTDSSSVSVVVSRLVERGLVRRTPDSEDRRRIVLALTPQGKALVRRAPRSAHERVAEAAASLSGRDLDALARTLGALAQSLDGHGDEEA
jgi:DNA-binding MarR family transcriptional regulator